MVEAGPVNPAPPLRAAEATMQTLTLAQRREGLRFDAARPGAGYLVLRYYPQLGVGRVDSGLFRPSEAASRRYDDFVAHLSGRYHSLRQDIPRAQ